MFEEANPRGFHLAANGQVLREYLAVATRPIESNGLGLGVAAAVANLEQFLKFLSVFEETESVALQLRQLVLTYAIRGKRVHDAGIVATMLAHKVGVLVGQDGDDFARFEEIGVVSLEDVLSRTKPGETVRGREAVANPDRAESERRIASNHASMISKSSGNARMAGRLPLAFEMFRKMPCSCKATKIR